MLDFLFSNGIIIYLQSFANPCIDFLFKIITYSGSYYVLFFLATLTYWCYDKKLGFKLMYVILISALLTIFTKDLFKMDRPPLTLHKVSSEGYGFPSGHALVSSAFLSYLWLNIRKGLVFVLLAIISISVSRVYLGVHYVGDITGGIFLGVITALIFYKYVFTTDITQTNLRYAVVLFPAAVLMLYHPEKAVDAGMMVISVGTGYLFEEKYIKFEDANSNLERIKRAFAGLLVVGVIYLASTLLEINSVIMYTMLGFASTFAVPWVFITVKS